MVIFKIKNEDGVLTYAFHDETYGKSCITGNGVVTFITAMKKYYELHPFHTTLTVMNDMGEYYSEKHNRYLHSEYPTSSYEIVLSSGR